MSTRYRSTIRRVEPLPTGGLRLYVDDHDEPVLVPRSLAAPELRCGAEVRLSTSRGVVREAIEVLDVEARRP